MAILPAGPTSLGVVIRIGTAGWQYRNWAGIVYPKPKPRGFDELAFIAGLFNTVEINSSFYGPPRPATSKAWMDRVANVPNFRFTTKLGRGFTHERYARRAMRKSSRKASDR